MAFDFKSFGETEDTSLERASQPVKDGESNFNFQSFGQGEDVPVSIPAKETKKPLLNRVASFLGMEKFGQGIGQAAFQLTPEYRNLTKMLEEGKITPDQFEEIATGGLTNKEVLGSAIQTGATFIPGAGQGVKLGTKVALGAGTGYAFDVGGNLQQNKQGAEVLKPGMGTLIGGGLPILGRITGLDKGLGKASQNASTKLEQINERLTPVEKQNLAKQGKGVSEYLARKKIIGTPETRFAKVNTLYDKMEDVVSKKVKESGVTYAKKDFIKEIEALPERFADDPMAYDEAIAQSKKMIDFLQRKAPNQIDAGLINSYKRNLFKRAYSKNNTDVVNETLHGIASILKDKLDASVPGLKVLNNEYGKIITAKQLLFKAQSRSQAGLIGKAAGLVAGGSIGGAVAGPGGAAVGSFIGPQAAEATMTPLRSLTGAGLQTIADVVEKIPTDQLGNLQLTKKALMDLIQQIRGS